MFCFIGFSGYNISCQSSPRRGWMLDPGTGCFEFLIYNLSQWRMQIARYTVGANNSVIVPGIYDLATTCGLPVLQQNSMGSPRLRLQSRLPGARPLSLGSPTDPHPAAVLSPAHPQGPATRPSAGPSPSSFLQTNYRISIAF